MVIKPIVEWNRPCLKKLFILLFAPVALVFGLFAEVRNRLYDAGLFQCRKRRSFVLGVGSLSVGGSGKTPLVEFLAIRLATIGVKVGVISNGYGKKRSSTTIVSDGEQLLVGVGDAGDEAFLMAVNFLEAKARIPVMSAANRMEAADILENKFGCRLIILDDSFQYRKIAKSLEVIVQDHMETEYPRLPLPVGRLREFGWNMNRADVMIITKTPERADLDSLRNQWGREFFVSHYRPAYVQHWFDGRRESLDRLNGRSVLVFSGLGHHASFLALVRELCNSNKATLLKPIEFQDHHWYTRSDMQKIFGVLKRTPLERCMILTTQKDAVKIKRDWVPAPFIPYVYYLRSEFTIESQIQFENLLKISDIN